MCGTEPWVVWIASAALGITCWFMGFLTAAILAAGRDPR